MTSNKRPAPKRLLSPVFFIGTQLLVLLLLFAPACLSAQTTKGMALNRVTPIKIKLARKLVSGRVRIGDYVPFVVAEDVLIHDETEGEWRTVIKKDTPVFGKVVDRKRRILFFRSGKFGVSLDEVRAVDGTSIPVFISRSTNRLMCRDKTSERPDNPANKNSQVPCVAGRTYSGSFTNALPSAVATTITTSALVLVKDSAAKTAAAVTLAGQVASSTGLAHILNGVDAEMDDGEIFLAVYTEQVGKPTIIKVAVTPGVNKDVRKVGRFENPTPHGYIITDYFSDLVKYPNSPGQRKVFTGKVIERYVDKPLGTTMNICAGEVVPPGWTVIDNPTNPNICPREPDDNALGATYRVIEKTRSP